MIVLSAVSAIRFASASFDEAKVPIGELSTQDGVVSGTVRVSGDHVTFYSGDRFRSNDRTLALNFDKGGSLVLCPHSEVQVLAASHNAGTMFALQAGGSEQPFPIHSHDVVMTPDWRIEMAGSVHGGDTGVLQVFTDHRGAVCLTGATQSGEFFRVSQLAGDTVFDVPWQSAVRIADGRMENSPAGCACEGASSIRAASSSASASNVASRPDNSFVAASASHNAAQNDTASAENLQPSRKTKQRSQDVAGYVRSFVHLMFGR
jgi:hypothetical protein